MTISQIKAATAQTSPHFFDRKTLKFFGQTMASFKVYKQANGTFKISAPMRMNGKVIGYTERIFDPTTNELNSVPK